MSEYERQRLSRMAENKARLEALGIPKAAEALLAPSEDDRPGEKKNDDDYRPGEDEIDDEEDEEFLESSSSVSRKRKKKTTRKQVLSKKKSLSRSDPLEEDDDLNKAIALSLQDSRCSKRKRNGQDAATCKTKKPELTMSKMQMTEDELLIYFYQFDEAGKGFITVRDLAKMATMHDFTWTDEELHDMIRCFDMDKDGKLSMDDFTKIVTRCRMLKES